MNSEAQQGDEKPASPSQLYRRAFSPEGSLLSIHEELQKAGLGLAAGWKCIAKQRPCGSREKQWDVEYFPPDEFQPANGQCHSKYRSRVAVLRAHGVSSRPPNWTPSPVAASMKRRKSTPSDQSPEAAAVTRKKRTQRGRPPKPQAQESRRKTDGEVCDDEHAQQEQPSQPPGKRRRASAPGPQTEESDPAPGKRKRGRPAKNVSTGQPHKNRKPGWGKWQQYSDMYEAKPKPKSISTWRQLTMQQDKPEEDQKQAAASDDIWDTEWSQSDDDESLDMQPNPAQKKQILEADLQQHAPPQNGAQKHKTSTPVHAGLQDSSSDEELDICGLTPDSLIAAHRIAKTEDQQLPET